MEGGGQDAAEAAEQFSPEQLPQQNSLEQIQPQQQQHQQLPSVSMMYNLQQQAFSAHSVYAPRVTDSTPDAPPSFQRADMAAAMCCKMEVLARLPSLCSHCSTALPFEAGCVVEDRHGNVWAYCKSKEAEACGRSEVLFTAPSRKVPVYEQCCVFLPPDSMFERHGTPTEMRMPGPPDLQPQSTTLEQLHGITPPEAPCATCERKFEDHHSDVDTNGWRVKCMEEEPLPAGWPSVEHN